MATLPGMMAQMPPLPVRPNLELAAAVLPPPGGGSGGGGGGSRRGGGGGGVKLER
jgi:hypothetical protein